MAIAVYCVLRHPSDFAAAVRLAANHSGDSDSTAAITGNITGALLGARAIPLSGCRPLSFVTRSTGSRPRCTSALSSNAGTESSPRVDIDWERWHWPGDSLPNDAYEVGPRLWAGPYPGAKARGEAKSKLSTLLDHGVSCFIDLTEERESALVPYSQLVRELAASRDQQVTYVRLPIRNVDVCDAYDPGHRAARVTPWPQGLPALLGRRWTHRHGRGLSTGRARPARPGGARPPRRTTERDAARAAPES